MPRLFHLFACLTVGVTLASCGAEPETEGASGTASQAIIAGESSPASQDAVVLLVHTDNESFFASCTGTLLAPNLVLTARHCVSETVDVPFSCGPNGEVVAGGRGGGTVSTDFDPSDIYVFVGSRRPNFRFGGSVQADAKGEAIHHDGSRVLCGHDLALVRLDRSLEDAPIASVRLDGETQAGERLTAVGWGVTNSSEAPAVRQQRTGIVIAAVGPFGDPQDGRAVPRNDFSVGESICSGDSGGPAFSERSGSVIGVVSRGGNGVIEADDPAAGCVGRETINHFARTSPFKDVILTAFEEAGYEPWLEGGPDPRLAPFGASCASDEECGSNLCTNGKCNQVCDATACPNGYECRAPDDQPGGPQQCRLRGVAAVPRSQSSCAFAGGAGAGGVWPVAAALVGLAAGFRRARRRSWAARA